MILDSVDNLNRVHAELKEFLASTKSKVRIDTITNGTPEPYDEFLPYFELLKVDGGITVKFGENRGLVISGSTEYLSKYIEAFEFNVNENGNHHHPEFSLINECEFSMGGLWPFVEADNEYVENDCTPSS